ncbi:spermidine synthase [Euwallacea similis]|uniref:spermidine synthase n=1 Tax=Euwallacea similis TaxID=1736056 RepID=UPI00344D5888
MDSIRNGWFSEISDMWPGQAFSLRVKELLFQGKSDYQDVLVIQTENHGKALVLDGILQCTEFDEFSYQEMITFLPLNAHPNPEKVLIIGGGDGGVAREVAKHPRVKQIVQVEIDRLVIDQSKKHLAFMAKGFESEKLTLLVQDGFEYMKNHTNEFDVVITDSSDPVGPAVNLFTESYFHLLKTALKSNGVISSQAGTLWTDVNHIKQTMKNCGKHFPVVKYATSNVPTYPNGQIGYLVAALDGSRDVTKPILRFTDEDIEEMKLRYYNPQIHEASFVLPTYFSKVLNG